MRKIKLGKKVPSISLLMVNSSAYKKLTDANFLKECVNLGKSAGTNS